MRLSAAAPLVFAIVALCGFRVAAIQIGGMLGVFDDPSIVATQLVVALILGIVGALVSGPRFHPLRWAICCLGGVVVWRLAFLGLQSLSGQPFVFRPYMVYEFLEWVLAIVATAVASELLRRALESKFETRTR